MNRKVLYSLLTFGFFVAMYFVGQWLMLEAYNQGMQDMHTLCAHVGGLVINKETGVAITCEYVGHAGHLL